MMEILQTLLLQTTLSYDNRNNLSETYVVKDEGNSLLESFLYDSEGNITAHTETGAVTGDYKKTDYTYDVNNRLVSTSVATEEMQGEENQNVTMQYIYDGVGNLLKEQSGNRSLAYE